VRDSLCSIRFVGDWGRVGWTREQVGEEVGGFLCKVAVEHVMNV
jgi:hypothetical protein